MHIRFPIQKTEKSQKHKKVHWKKKRKRSTLQKFYNHLFMVTNHISLYVPFSSWTMVMVVWWVTLTLLLEAASDLIVGLWGWCRFWLLQISISFPSLTFSLLENHFHLHFSVCWSCAVLHLDSSPPPSLTLFWCSHSSPPPHLGSAFSPPSLSLPFCS